VRPLYKHILGWPIAFSDLEHTDHYMHDSLLKMTKMDDVSVCGIDFTVTEEMLGDNLTVELKPGGEQVTVSNDNLNECKSVHA
jgi:HECT-domain (ubiquitin-transferase)